MSVAWARCCEGRYAAHGGPSRLSSPQRSLNAKDAKSAKNAKKTLNFLCGLCVLCELCVPLHGGRPSAEQPLRAGSRRSSENHGQDDYRDSDTRCWPSAVADRQAAAACHAPEAARV